MATAARQRDQHDREASDRLGAPIDPSGVEVDHGDQQADHQRRHDPERPRHEVGREQERDGDRHDHCERRRPAALALRCRFSTDIGHAGHDAGLGDAAHGAARAAALPTTQAADRAVTARLMPGSPGAGDDRSFARAPVRRERRRRGTAAARRPSPRGRRPRARRRPWSARCGCGRGRGRGGPRRRRPRGPSAYASPSSRSGSNSPVRISAGGRSDRSAARSGEAFGSGRSAGSA